jgi:pimeloyl-ACP methyl ester carboxylesterase
MALRAGFRRFWAGRPVDARHAGSRVGRRTKRSPRRRAAAASVAAVRRPSSWLLLVLACAACLTPPPAGEGTKVPGEDVDAPKRLRTATDVAKVYAKGEVRQFEMRQAGQSIGTSWGRYIGVDADGNHRFETRIELRLPGRAPARSAGELVLDARGRLVRGVERSSAAELVFERRGDAIVLSDGTREDEVTYDPDRVDTAFMAHSAIVHAELMYALREITTAPMAWRLVSLSGGPPVEWSGRVLDATDDASTIRIDTSLGEIITLTDGRIAAIDVEATDLRILAVDEPAWPTFTIAGPKRLVWTKPANAKFEVREVELPGKAEEPTLAGEVLVPEATGPLPAVLMLSATGQEDRYGFAGPPPVDLGTHELTDALADAGFVVLRFDERGRGKSSAGELGFVSQLADARRALAVLSIQPEVDPDRIVVVGHGEGGLRALALANDRAADVHAVALLGTPGRPYDQVLRAQAAARLEELPPDVREDARAQQNQMIEDLVKGKAIPPELAPQATWLREIFAVRPAELVARVRVPILLAQGGKDFEVDPVADVLPLEKAAKRGRVKLEVRRYADLDHLFKPEPGTSTPERYRIDRRVDTTFITDVVAWTRRVTQKK